MPILLYQANPCCKTSPSRPLNHRSLQRTASFRKLFVNILCALLPPRSSAFLLTATKSYLPSPPPRPQTPPTRRGPFLARSAPRNAYTAAAGSRGRSAPVRRGVLASFPPQSLFRSSSSLWWQQHQSVWPLKSSCKPSHQAMTSESFSEEAPCSSPSTSIATTTAAAAVAEAPRGGGEGGSVPSREDNTALPASASPRPPVAERDENRFVYAGTPREGGNPDPKLPRQSDGSPYPLLDPPVAIPDPYGWMRDEKRSDPKVLGHLEKENEYTRLKTAHLVALRGQLYDEMVGSLQETDYTAPRPRGPQYAYYTRTYEGKPYQVHCRAPRNAALPHPNDGEEKEEGNARSQWDGTAESPVFEGEQVLLDVNVLAEGKPYCEVATKVSPSHRLMAYAADFTGDEMCGLYVINLDSRGGEVVDHDPDLVVYGSLQWGVDDSSLFYLKMDATQRPYQLWRRSIAVGDGETGSRGTDELLFEEPNELYWMGIYKSLDGKYLFMEVSSKETSEIWYLDLKPQDGGSSELRCVARRREKVLYEVEHRNGQWWIASNVGGLPNFAVFTCPATEDSAGNWKLVTDASGSVLFDGGYGQSVDGATCFRDHVVVTGREGGLPRVWVLGGIESGSDSGTVTVVTSKDRLTFEEDAYDVMLGSHYEFDTDQLAVVYDSMITPSQTLEIDMSDPSRRRVLKAKRVPGYDRSQYGCDRTFVPSRDGRTQIPVSLVYRKDVMETHLASGEPVHVHLYGYGSYGSCTEADWRATRLPLINRGIVFAQAHVRGGGEMGRQWYEEPDGAKYLCKKNTFYDFIDVANWLVDDRKMTTPALLSCEGRSAGGMLIGASINEAPHLFRAAILGVPFVDVICTMIDASIPLTTAEWAEWGNPNEERYHSYMMSYCPMQNIKKGVAYPSCLLTGGLHDPRVQYWEIGKFAATLRHAISSSGANSAASSICLKIDMSAGHFSASDRYKYLRELSFDYAFLLDEVGLVSALPPAAVASPSVATNDQ